MSTSSGDAKQPSPPMYGGQAVIEGVMMRGPRHFAVAARRANGEVALVCEAVPKSLRPAWQKWPLLRGAFALVDSMALGTKALFWAAKVAEADIPKAQAQAEEGTRLRATAAGMVGTTGNPSLGDQLANAAQRKAVEDAEREIRLSSETVGPAMGAAVAARDPEPISTSEPPLPHLEGKKPSSRVTDIALGGAMFTGLLIAVALFKVLPIALVGFVQSRGWVTEFWQLGLVDAAIRFTIFFTYIGLVSRMKHVRRVFEYHGAEHKAINALEAHGVGGLTVANARAASRLHPRCGTSFVVIVLLLSVLAISPFYGLPLYWRLPLGVLMLFPVAGVSFELLRLAGKYRDNPVAAVLSRPGMWTQLMTTREPDDSQVEVAIASLRAVMDAEKAEQKEAPTTAVPTTAASVA